MKSRLLRKAAAAFATVGLVGAGVVGLMAAPASAASPCQTGCSLGTTAVTIPDFVNGASTELGMTFHVNAPGIVNSVAFYVSPSEQAFTAPLFLHRVSVWRLSGPGGPAGLLASSAIMPSVSGVNNFGLLASVPVTPGDEYIASYGSGNAMGYTPSPGGLPASNGTLVGDAGIYSLAGAGTQPNASNGNSYGISPHFVERPAAPLITSVQFVSNTSAIVTFSNDGVVSGTSYSVSCTSTGLPTAVGSGSSSPITATGFTTGASFSCIVTATNTAGSTASAPFVTPGVSGKSGPGCTGTVSAPTQLSAASMAFPGAVVSWAPAVVDPVSCLSGYVVTPSEGTTALPPTFVSPNNTTTHVDGLTLGHTYTFTVTAVSGTNVSDASDPTGPVTIGTPAAVTSVHVANAGKGAVKVAFKAGSGNGAKITGFIATCGGKSTLSKSSPIIVKGLKSGNTYHCTVRAANSRGVGATARSAAVRA